MNEHILFTQKVRKYQGKYIAVVGKRIIASGRMAVFNEGTQGFSI